MAKQASPYSVIWTTYLHVYNCITLVIRALRDLWCQPLSHKLCSNSFGKYCLLTSDGT